MSGESSEGKDRDCVRISRGVSLWQIVVGAEIQANGWLPRIYRPYKTKGFALGFRTLPPCLRISNLRRQSPKPLAFTS